MSDLYRRLLHDITARFGGTVDDANADAIAYAAAELYHRDLEPHLWEEKSAHDLLDLFGIPRAGVFAPYSLSDRLLLFQRRSSQAQYVTRAHEVLSALGVPRHDETGSEQSLKWRIEKVLATVNGEDEGGNHNEDSGDDSEGGDKAADDMSRDGAAEDGGDRQQKTAVTASDSEVVAAAGHENGSEKEQPEPGFAPLAEEPDGEPATSGNGPLSSTEPSPAQLVEAVRALEQAAELEAELAKPEAAVEGTPGVDLVSLTETLSRIQGEIAALRDLVEAFELGMRRQLDELQSQLRNSSPGTLSDSGPPNSSGPAPLIPRPVDPTNEMPPVVLDEQPPSLASEVEGGRGRRHGRRALLVVLLTVIGMLIAGGIAVAVAVGWETIRPDAAGMLPPWRL